MQMCKFVGWGWLWCLLINGAEVLISGFVFTVQSRLLLVPHNIEPKLRIHTRGQDNILNKSLIMPWLHEHQTNEHACASHAFSHMARCMFSFCVNTLGTRRRKHSILRSACLQHKQFYGVFWHHSSSQAHTYIYEWPPESSIRLGSEMYVEYIVADVWSHIAKWLHQAL